VRECLWLRCDQGSDQQCVWASRSAVLRGKAPRTVDELGRFRERVFHRAQAKDQRHRGNGTLRRITTVLYGALRIAAILYEACHDHVRANKVRRGIVWAGAWNAFVEGERWEVEVVVALFVRTSVKVRSGYARSTVSVPSGTLAGKPGRRGNGCLGASDPFGMRRGCASRVTWPVPCWKTDLRRWISIRRAMATAGPSAGARSGRDHCKRRQAVFSCARYRGVTGGVEWIWTVQIVRLRDTRWTDGPGSLRQFRRWKVG